MENENIEDKNYKQESERLTALASKTLNEVGQTSYYMFELFIKHLEKEGKKRASLQTKS